MNFGNIVIMMSRFGSKSGDFAQRGNGSIAVQEIIVTTLKKFYKSMLIGRADTSKMLAPARGNSRKDSRIL